ncbi:cation transporter, partial [Thalassolituus alkanivorans]
GARLVSTMPVASESIARAQASAKQEAEREAGILKWLLAINGIMFVIEITVGWWAQSTGLIADSLDMFADAAVYGVALYAVGHSVRMKLRAAHFSGWLQIILALGALGEVVRRLVLGSEPVSTLMMSFGLVALAANVTCLLLIAKSRDSGAHMKASWIFSANDVIANLGVILAGGLVAWTGSRYPDLVIGLIIGLIVLNGARRILQLKS